jgi:hypothetical protein
LVTGSDVAREPGIDWPLPREPLLLDTSRPAIIVSARLGF